MNPHAASTTLDSLPMSRLPDGTKGQIDGGDVHKQMLGSSFPWILHKVLEDAESEPGGFAHSISFFPGSSQVFKIYNPIYFAAHIMGRYFKHQTKYKSFQRQLNLWGFQRVRSGRMKGGYMHDCFVRGNPRLVDNMKRCKIKGKANKHSSMDLSRHCQPRKDVAKMKSKKTTTTSHLLSESSGLTKEASTKCAFTGSNDNMPFDMGLQGHAGRGMVPSNAFDILGGDDTSKLSFPEPTEQTDMVAPTSVMLGEEINALLLQINTKGQGRSQPSTTSSSICNTSSLMEEAATTTGVSDLQRLSHALTESGFPGSSILSSMIPSSCCENMGHSSPAQGKCPSDDGLKKKAASAEASDGPLVFDEKKYVMIGLQMGQNGARMSDDENTLLQDALQIPSPAVFEI